MRREGRRTQEKERRANGERRATQAFTLSSAVLGMTLAGTAWGAAPPAPAPPSEEVPAAGAQTPEQAPAGEIPESQQGEETIPNPAPVPAVEGNAEASEAPPLPVPPGYPEVDPFPPDVPKPPPSELPPSGDPASPAKPIPSPGASPTQPPPAAPIAPIPTVVPPSTPIPGVPVETPGTPQDATEGTLPGATPGTREYPLTVNALWGVYRPDPNTVRARGDVVLTYRDVVLTADELTADLNTRDVHAKGNVVVQSGGRTIRGDDLTFNLRTRYWRIGQGRAAFLPRQLLSPLFVRGAEFSGDPHIIEGVNGSITTCDLPDPHYHLQGREITILPGERAVLKHASLYVNNRRWLTIPRLVIPLQRSQYNIVPRFGQNNVEGYFVKSAYYYPTRLGQTGIARVDLMSKKGIGLGVDQGYRFASGAGQVVLYSILGAGALQGREWNGSLRHQQRFGDIAASLRSEFRQNSYQFASQSTSVSHVIDLARRTTRGATTLGFRSDRSSSGTGVGTYDREGWTLGQTQTWGTTSARLNVDLFDTRSANFQERELNTQVNLDRRLPTYDLSLIYSQRHQLETSTPGFFSSLNRLPELVFGTHRNRVKGGLFRSLPGSFGLSVGEFHEEPGSVRSMRVLLDMGIDNRRYAFGNSTLDVSGSFKQAVYSSEAAQYLVNANANWRTPFTRHNEFAVNYILLSPKGYTPFRFDTLGEYHLLTADFVHREKRFRAAVGTGRDLRGGPFSWHDVRTRLQYSPSDRFYLAASSAYDLNQGNWRDVITDTRFKFGRGFLNLGMRYTPINGRVGTIRWNFFTPLGPKYSIQTLGGWNGFSRQYDYRMLRFNWEHHDFRASLSYVEQIGFQNQKGIRLMVNLRALPIREEFATGPFGQSLGDTEVGEIF